MGCHGVVRGGYGGYEWQWVVTGSFGVVTGDYRWLWGLLVVTDSYECLWVVTSVYE